MNHIRTIIRKSFLALTAGVIAVVLPLGTFAGVSADAVLKSDTGCAIPAPSSYGPGTRTPTGSTAVAFTYQCTDPNNASKPYVGDWLSAHYVYDPTTQTTTALDPTVYTYDATTGQYDYSNWVYNVPSSGYVQVDGSVATPPAGAQVIGGPAPVVNTPASDTSDDSNGSANATPDSSIGGTGSGSNNTVTTNGTNDSTTNNNTSAGVANQIGGTATSGNAVELANTTGGDATSGSATNQADVVNMLQSSSNSIGSGSNVATFTYNIDGNVDGDLLFDPADISNVQGDSTIDNNQTNNAIINNTSDATINNNIDLAAASGDATVSQNTTAGNATTGNATNIVNVVNSIRSIITSGKSFVGTININGNLNGDILIPANFVNQLIADNVPTDNVAATAPDSTNSYNSTTNNTATVKNTNNEGVNNNVTESAGSGNANSSQNTTAGNATTGTATNNLTAFNLTGTNVVGTNDLLVFVNVLGTWTGLIVNAPAGATAAELGGNTTVNNTVNNTATENNDVNQQINNNIDTTAQSGNATSTENTTAGNATSGNAQNAVNLLNIEGSTINLSNWFGILFINVFGTWNGSFGVNTSAGNAAAAAAAGDGTLVGHTSFVNFIPSSTASTTASQEVPASAAVTPPSTTNPAATTTGSVLAAKTTKGSAAPTPQLQARNDDYKTFVLIGGLVVLYVASDAFISRRRRLHKVQ
jgi:hypothetical protein